MADAVAGQRSTQPFGGIEDLFAGRFVLLAGPCVAESLPLCLQVAQEVAQMCAKRDIGYIFKASFDKANRTHKDSFRGHGMQEGLAILAKVREQTQLACVTDIHLPEQAAPVAEVVDMLQIPAFLSRQSDLLAAAAQTGRAVNVKKGQFLAPDDMVHVAQKMRSYGCKRLAITERGTTFGYHNLVVDMRGLVHMRANCDAPIIFDATHSVQTPGGASGRSGGDRTLAGPLARAATAVGIDALFCEVHPDPDNALSDGPNSLSLPMLETLLDQIVAIRAALAAVATP